MSVFYTTKPPLLNGAGIRWTPLRHSAEAPTEPAGETLSRHCVTEGFIRTIDNRPYGSFNIYEVVSFVRHPVGTSIARPILIIMN